MQDGETHVEHLDKRLAPVVEQLQSGRVRAQYTAAMLPAPWQHQPRQQDQLWRQLEAAAEKPDGPDEL